MYCFSLFFKVSLEQYVIRVLFYQIVMGEDTHFIGYLNSVMVKKFLLQKCAFKFEINWNYSMLRDFFSPDCSHFSLRVWYMHELHIINRKVLLLEKVPKHFFRNMTSTFSLFEFAIFLPITQISSWNIFWKSITFGKITNDFAEKWKMKVI